MKEKLKIIVEFNGRQTGVISSQNIIHNKYVIVHSEY